MADVEVLKRRKITETLLERARRALPAVAEQYATLLAQYREFLDHREHELALDILEEIGRLVPCRGRF